MRLSLIMSSYCIINCHKIDTNCIGLYKDSPIWIKNKKTTINLIIKKENKYFQYVLTVILNYEDIKRNPLRITKIKSFINKYNWEEIRFIS